MASTDLDQSQIKPGIKIRNLLVIASPVVIVIIGSLAARISIQLFGQWAWAGTAPIYWGCMVAVIALFSGRKQAASWFGKPRGSIFWPILALLVGLSPIPMLLLPNLALLRTPLLVAAWVAFGLINGTVEEAYWRGFLFTEIRGWPLWLTVTYSSILFIAVHFLMLGAFSEVLFNVPFLLILIFLTLIFAVMFLRTRSLRWPVFMHILADLGNMNVFVFMNMIRPF